MKYVLRGRIHAIVCDEPQHSLANTTVRLYRFDDKDATRLVAAQSKEAFQFLEEKEIKAKAKRLLAETKTDAQGNYAFEIDGDKQKYKGEAVEFDVYYAEIPDYGQNDTKKARNYKAFQATLDVIQPRWRETNEGLLAQWNHSISRKWWCSILRRLDIWVICGVLLDCKSQQPQAGVEVIAMDDDVISDDQLGTAITDASGRFCIFYRSKDFKKTFLSPFINIETPIFPLGNGPDIYFKFALGGSIFHEESPSEARKPGRENVDNCLCVRLCIEGGQSEPISSFFHIGDNRRYHIVLNINPADGRTINKNDPSEAGWNEQAFYSTLALLGTLEKTLNGQPMEYKFQYIELGSPTDPIPTNEAAWTDVLKTDIANGTIIGFTPKFSLTPPPPHYNPDIYAINPKVGQIEVLFNGNWIIVPQTAQSLTGRLINLISTKLASGNVDMTGLIQGNSTTSIVPLQKNRYFSLRMKKRQAGNAATEVVAGTSRPIAIFNTTFDKVPQGGSWLLVAGGPELGVASLDLQELATAGGCSNIADSITVKYTAANPNLGTVNLTFTGPGATNSFQPIVFPTPGEEAYGTSLYTGNFGELENCAYEIRLNAELNLTNGEDQHDGIWDRVLFCR